MTPVVPEDWSDGFKYWLQLEPKHIPEPPTTLVEELVEYVQGLDDFCTASAGVMAQYSAYPSGNVGEKSPEIEGYYLLQVIKIQVAINRIQFASCFHPDPMIWDDYESVFQEIVDSTPTLIPYLVKSRSLGDEQQSGFTFHFLVSILIVLATVVNLCRIQPIRDQALTLLARIYNEANDYKEGICEIRIIYWLAKALRDWEEVERDDNGSIPGHKRLAFAADLQVGPKTVACNLWRGYGAARTLVVREYEHHLRDEGVNSLYEDCIQDGYQIHLRS
jgi:hypothetical protein